MSNFLLPGKVHLYLERLRDEYKRKGYTTLVHIVSNAQVHVEEGVEYDDLNDQSDHHNVWLFLSQQDLNTVDLDEQDELCRVIRNGLNTCSNSIVDECFDTVHIQPVDENDERYQEAVPVAESAQIDPDSVSFWKPGYVRMFISHRDPDKEIARELADGLEAYGISAFVAHKEIDPTDEWKDEILKGLKSMEVMLAIIMDDFHNRVWPNQEIGFAFAQKVPIVSIKFDEKDPQGFISSSQAMNGKVDELDILVENIYNVLTTKLGKKERLQRGLVAAFVNAKRYAEVSACLYRMESSITNLSEDEEKEIVDSFKMNYAISQCKLIRENDRFLRFMRETTNKEYMYSKNRIAICLEEAPEDSHE